MAFSEKLLRNPEAKNADALRRIELAKRRIQSVLDRERVAHQKTLEQKISDQGPNNQRVDPHLLGLAIMDMREQKQLKEVKHKATGKQIWLSNRLTKKEDVIERINILAPLYAGTLNLSNSIGDALEIITEKAIAGSIKENPRYSYMGHFLLEKERDKHGRIRKCQPPKTVGSFASLKEADFLIFGHDCGPICVECKNYREWFYPHHGEIKSTIIKAYELGTVPLFIGRRIHYTTRENLFSPAGILYHETFYQYYDPIHKEIASRAKDKTLLGFSDIRASHEPDSRTKFFFTDSLPLVIEAAAEKWKKNKEATYAYATNQMHLAQLYNEIGSPASGNWTDPDEPPF